MPLLIAPETVWPGKKASVVGLWAYYSNRFVSGKYTNQLQQSLAIIIIIVFSLFMWPLVAENRLFLHVAHIPLLTEVTNHMLYQRRIAEWIAFLRFTGTPAPDVTDKGLPSRQMLEEKPCHKLHGIHKYCIGAQTSFRMAGCPISTCYSHPELCTYCWNKTRWLISRFLGTISPRISSEKG
jgi:hypothetical protein